jgi:hypothetical protein
MHPKAIKAPRPQKIPPSYTLDDTLKLLHLKTRQGLYASSLDRVIRHYAAGRRSKVYDAADVERWTKPLMRLQIEKAWGLKPRTTRHIDAPTDAGADATCPRCGEFAIKHPDKKLVRCIKGHVARPAADSA